jgi:hypothetical protein
MRRVAFVFSVTGGSNTICQMSVMRGKADLAAASSNRRE